MGNFPSSWDKRADLRIFRRMLKLFPDEFLEEYEYEMVQAFRDQIKHTTSKSEYITLWLKVFLDLIKNAIQERINEFSIENHPALADVLWILGFTFITAFTTYLWINYGQRIFRLLENTPFFQSVWSDLAISAVMGFIIGLSQWLFIRKHIQFNWAWPFATGILFSVGKFISGGIDYYVITHLDKLEFLCKLSVYDPNYLANIRSYIRLFITAYFVSLSQTVFIPESRFRWLWIPISLIARVCDRLVMLYLGNSFYRLGPINNWAVFGDLAEGLILAVFLRLLFIHIELENKSGKSTSQLGAA